MVLADHLRSREDAADLDEALKKLNLGISSWVSFHGWDDGPFSEVHEIGYSKINSKWGIGIKRIIEDQTQPDGYQIDETTGSSPKPHGTCGFRPSHICTRS